MTENHDYNIIQYHQELSDLWHDSELSIKDKYVELYRIFNEILADGTKNNKIEFASSFARFTYIAQQTNLAHEITQKINGLRGRCKNICNTEFEEAERHFPFDVKCLVEFLIILNGEYTGNSDTKETNNIALNKLFSLMPAGNLLQKRSTTAKDYIRVSVKSFDEKFIIAEPDEDHAFPITICYNDDNNFLGNWSHIGQLLKLDFQSGRDKGIQLNIIHPKFDNGIYYPELIIYQPDLLIDISSISKCFEQHGASPYYHLIKKLKENKSTKATLLGNFASQLLDEAINTSESTDSYSDSVTNFFKSNAMSIVACNDDMSTFHDDAKAQQENIKQIIRNACEEDNTIDLKKVLLEPSFFCEMLGLQGRMDLMHSDYRVLMEQKSGKKDYKTNGHVEQHYVQVLLYMAILHYVFKLRNDEISCFLLYSKYPNGLIKEGPAPKVLFKAIQLRNQIVWNEFSLANGGINILDKLAPEHLNTNKQFDNFWKNWKLPEIMGILDVVKSASSLEKAYFYRMYQFVAKEHILAKCGTAKREGSGMASIWNSTLEEKKQAGNIFDNLRIENNSQLSKDAVHGGITELTLSIPPQDDDYLPNFRIGDIVILFKYNKNDIPDARKGMIFRTSIKDVKDNKIQLRLRAPQKNSVVFNQDDTTVWAIEHDFMESSYSSLYRSLFSVLTANEDRKQLILGQRKAKVDTTIQLKNDYSSNGQYPAFNDLVLKAMQAQDYFIVIGPPGTGKTSFGMLNILKETLATPDSSVLLLSYTNRAVDEICSKLVKDNIDFIRIGSELSCPDCYKKYLLENKIANCKNTTEIRNILLNARVFAGTTTSLTSHQEIFTLRTFSLAIIDEASQILEPHLLGLLCAKHNNINAIQKFIFIGDHKQLPAVVLQPENESVVSDPLLNEIGLTNCRHSLFERLLHLQDNDSTFVFRLNRQGRMHNDVADFSRQYFYDNNLGTVPLDHQHKTLNFPNTGNSKYHQLLSTHRIAFVNVDSPRRTASYKVNIPEAIEIAQAVLAVWELYNMNGRPFNTDSTVGVIVPYRHQIAIVRHEIDRFGIPELHNITIDTVERYQGSERDVIIYGFTIQRAFQLEFLTNNVFEENGKYIDRKLNVAITRAREQMLLIGNERLLSTNPLFLQLINYIQQQ